MAPALLLPSSKVRMAAVASRLCCVLDKEGECEICGLVWCKICWDEDRTHWSREKSFNCPEAKGSTRMRFLGEDRLKTIVKGSYVR